MLTDNAHRFQPAPFVFGATVEQSEKGVLDGGCNWTARSVADFDSIDHDTRRIDNEDGADDDCVTRTLNWDFASLLAVERALERAELGAYGQCQGCDKPIRLSRLRAVPHATLCMECQTAEDIQAN